MIVMINLTDRQQVHELIVLEFAIRTLKHDYPYVEKLKTKAIYVPMHNSLLKNISSDYFKLKHQLKKKKLSIAGWQRIDQYFSDIHIATAGDNQTLRYANQALKTEVERVLIRYTMK